MAPALLDRIAASAWAGAGVFVIESSMGLFDGIGGPVGRRGSAADLAARFGLPVVLVLDVSGQSQSAAAVAAGFARHDPAVRVAGVVLNQVASARHREGVEAAMAAIGMPVLGCVMRDAAIALPERHLGLVQAGEHAGLAARLDALADLAESELDLDGILAAAAPLGPVACGVAVGLPPPGQRIALAWDAAFSFVYPHLLQSWQQLGAEIFPFSPLGGEAPSAQCDVAWLPGGYPELHAGRLAAASGFLEGLRDFARGHAVHGECGGFMVLGEGLEDAQGVRHAMAGLLGHATSFARRKMNLGYRQATLLANSPLGPAGSQVRGHEFHYASVIEAGADAPLVRLLDGAGRSLGTGGGRRGAVSGTFFHAIAPAQQDIP
jgi:cobyrinic acid a,c-diamide synthase